MCFLYLIYFQGNSISFLELISSTTKENRLHICLCIQGILVLETSWWLPFLSSPVGQKRWKLCARGVCAHLPGKLLKSYRLTPSWLGMAGWRGSFWFLPSYNTFKDECTYCVKVLVVSVTLWIVVVLCIIVWFERPGPWYVSVNWKAPPGVCIVKFGLSSRFKPFHVEVTPSNVICVLLIEPDPVGVRLPSADTPDPVTEYCQPVL